VGGNIFFGTTRGTQPLQGWGCCGIRIPRVGRCAPNPGLISETPLGFVFRYQFYCANIIFYANGVMDVRPEVTAETPRVGRHAPNPGLTSKTPLGFVFRFEFYGRLYCINTIFYANGVMDVRPEVTAEAPRVGRHAPNPGLISGTPLRFMLGPECNCGRYCQAKSSTPTALRM
jgi:hypothetical protein